MTSITSLGALRLRARLQTRWMVAAEPASRSLHASAIARKDPPLKGPVPTETKAKTEEGGDGFLGVRPYFQALTKNDMSQFDNVQHCPRTYESLRPSSTARKRPSKRG